MILFETTTSVFELLWDIVLAFFILRIAFTYFFLCLTTGFMTGILRVRYLEQYYTVPQAELIELPWLFAINTVWAHYVIVKYEIPRSIALRLAIGGAALCYMLIAETIGGIILWREGLKKWIWETDLLAGGLGALVLMLFGIMPVLLMGLEGNGKSVRRDTCHGHEEKAILGALPTIRVTIKAQMDEPKAQ